MPKTPRLRDLLIREGLVTEKQVEDAARYIDTHGGNISESLIHLGYLRPDELERFVVAQKGVFAIDLSQLYAIQDLCKLLPADFVREHQIFPIDQLGPVLTVGMAMPLDEEAIARVAEVSGMRVRAVYCNPKHIAGAINRYFAPQETAAFGEYKEVFKYAKGSTSMISIAQILRKIGDLPTLAETVRKTKEALDDPSIAMEDIVSVIERDPLVSVKVLKLANSAAYNFSRQIDDVGMAIRLLGLQETYSLVLASTVLSIAEGTKGFDYNRFWHEALFAAAAIPELADAVNTKRSAKLSTAALLHDIGQFVIAETEPDSFKKLNFQASGSQLVAQEEEMFGLTHPEVGFAVAEHWELPEEIPHLIRHHHAPTMAGDATREAAALSLATFLAESHSRQVDLHAKDAFSEVQPVLDQYRVSPFRLIEIFKRVQGVFLD